MFKALVLFLIWLPYSAWAVERALVIGNDTYTHLSPLLKANEDALGYQALFTRRGFEVTTILNGTMPQMQRKLAVFYESIRPGDTVVFAYSGHGWSDGTQNYLVPTDAETTTSVAAAKVMSIPLKNGANGILDNIAQRSALLTVAIIDACRNNPFGRNLSRSVGVSSGLAPIEPAEGTFLVYSAGVGQTALDRLGDVDTQQYSVFTRFFLRNLDETGDLRDSIIKTRGQVQQAAALIGANQRPAYYDELSDTSCIFENCGAPPPPAAQTPIADMGAAEAWAVIRDAQDPALLAAFVQQFKDTEPYYALLAQRRLEALASASVPEEPAADPVMRPAPPAANTMENPQWVNIATATTKAEALALLATYTGAVENAHAYQVRPTYFKIALGPYADTASAFAAANHLRSNGTIPIGSFVTDSLGAAKMIDQPASPEATRTERHTAFLAAIRAQDAKSALTRITTQYPGTNEAFLAGRLLLRLAQSQPVSMRRPAAVAPPRPASAEDQSAIVQRCDLLAAQPDNADNPNRVTGVAIDHIQNPEAIDICDRAAQTFPDHARSQFQLGRAYYSAGKYAAAAGYYGIACDLDYAIACRSAGAQYFYNVGLSLSENSRYPLAGQFYEKACGLADATACNDLAYLYRSVETFGINQTRATEFYAKACELGNIGACVNLGSQYRNNRGVSGSASERESTALALYASACKAEDSSACRMAGNIELSRDRTRLAMGYWLQGLALGDRSLIANLQQMPRDQVLALQQVLSDRGQYSGTVDGRPTRLTEAALSAICGC